MRTALIFVLAATAAYADYHVVPNGDDAGTGTAEAPFATIGRAAVQAGPGDVVHVHAGTYRETVTVINDGTAMDPVTFRAAGDGPVVLSGADRLTGWTEAAPGQWVVDCAEPVVQLFHDGAMLNEACWPNSPAGNPMKREWALARKDTEAGRITAAKLPEADFTGATIHVLPGSHWVSWTRNVDALEDGVIVFNADWEQSHAYRVQDGTRFFLFGHEALLDAPGEWWYDADAKQLHLRLDEGVDPNASRVELKQREWAFDLTGRNHVRVEGFRIFGASITLKDAQHCTVRDTHIRYASHFTDARSWSGRNDSGLVIGGSDNTVERCSVVYSAGNGITLLGERNTVDNCVVRNANYNATDLAAVWAEGRENTLRRSTLSHTGRSVFIHRTLKAGRIEYNDMHHAGLMTGDLGITYCFNTDGEGTVFAYNWVHDNVSLHTGCGIYIDNNSANFTVHHNVSWNNTNSGIRLNTTSTNNKVYNNTVIDNGNSIDYWGPDDLDDQPGCESVNNVFTDSVRYGEGMNAHHNYEGDAPMLVDAEARDFRPAAGSPLIDAGTPIEGITGEYQGAAPDLGAYEHGGEAWTAGHDWGEPPVF